MRDFLVKLSICSLLLVSVLLSGCGLTTSPPSGDGNNTKSLSLSLSAPSEYPANLPESITVVMTITNTSGVNANNLIYSVPNITNYTGKNNITINATGGGQNCANLAAGASCSFTATIAPFSKPGAFTVLATPSAVVSKAEISKNLLLAATDGSISVTANLGLVQIPTNTNIFYILPGNQTVNATPNQATTVLVSVLVEQESAFDNIVLVDGLGNQLSYSLVGSIFESSIYSINTYSVAIPYGVTSQSIQAHSTLGGNPACDNSGCSNNAVVNIASSGTGILQVQPSNFSLDDIQTSQVVTLVNSGSGTVSSLVLPSVAAP